MSALGGEDGEDTGKSGRACGGSDVDAFADDEASPFPKTRATPSRFSTTYLSTLENSVL